MIIGSVWPRITSMSLYSSPLPRYHASRPNSSVRPTARRNCSSPPISKITGCDPSTTGRSAASASEVSGGRKARPLDSYASHARMYQSASMKV